MSFSVATNRWRYKSSNFWFVLFFFFSFYFQAADLLMLGEVAVNRMKNRAMEPAVDNSQTFYDNFEEEPSNNALGPLGAPQVSKVPTCKTGGIQREKIFVFFIYLFSKTYFNLFV